MKIFGYIYLITNLTNGKVYVGQTSKSLTGKKHSVETRKKMSVSHKLRQENIRRIS